LSGADDRLLVVGLQEIGCRSDDGGDVAALAAATGLSWRATPTPPGASAPHGNALLSALPLGALRVHDLTMPGREPRSALEVPVQWGGRRLRVVVTHLGLRAGERRAQVARLLASVPADDRSADVTIVLGDINEWWLWGRPLRWLHQRFGTSPAPRSFPAYAPFLALDRVWVHPEAALGPVTAVGAGQARRASDHLPVVATLHLPRGATDDSQDAHA
jgi:endonuclease/exonuclease/phosphatase family metal-dependent hydrolase